MHYPERLALSEEEYLRPVGLIRSRRLLPGWTVVDGYEKLVRAIAPPGVEVDDGHPERRNLNADVVLVPYDFRRSITEAAEVLARQVRDRLAGLSAVEQQDRVIVIAHSLGGLVARYWLGPLGGWRVCRALVTLGTPHRGAPKALDWLVNGVRLGPLLLTGPMEVFRGWRSAAELLPRYRVIRDETGQARDGWYPHELPVDWLRPVAERAFRVHSDIEVAMEAIPRRGPELVPRFAWSHATLASASWNGQRLRVTKEHPWWVTPPGWEEDSGDGTVPAISAVPVEDGSRDTTQMRVPDRHGRMAAAAWVAPILSGYERRGATTPVRGEERPAAIGLDLDETHQQGRPLPLLVRLRGLPAQAAGDASRVPVWVSLRREDALAPTCDMRLDWDGTAGCFTGELPAQAPGLYEVEITARGVPSAGDLAVAESVAVIDP